MKPILKSIYIILTIFMLASCTSKTEEQATQKAETEKPAKVAKADEETQEEKAEPKKTSEELARQKRIKEYTDLLIKMKDEFLEKKKKIEKRTPARATLEELKKRKTKSNYFDNGVYYINFESCIRENALYKCKQKVKLDTNNILEYEVVYGKKTFKFDGESADSGYIVEYDDDKVAKSLGDFPADIKLISNVNIGKVDKEIIEDQVHGEIYSLKDDPKAKEMIKLFEEYESEKYPSVNSGSYYDFKVLDYIKGKFTNSGYDEYIVMMGKDYRPYNGDSKSLSRIDRLRCCVVDNDKIIKDYDLNACCSIYYMPKLDERDKVSTEQELKDLKNFGYLFSQGWVNDFNQNGINEMYISSIGAWSYEFIILEFSGKDFEINYVSPWDNGMHPVLQADWKTKTIKFKTYKCANNISEYMENSFQWNDDIKEFVLKEMKYKTKEER